MDEYIRWGARAVGWAAEIGGVMIVLIAIVRGLLLYLIDLITRVTTPTGEQTRLNLGRSLTLALEFLLAADIVQTAVAPTWEEIGQLAAIVTIRTVLNYFLQREILREQSMTSILTSRQLPVAGEAGD